VNRISGCWEQSTPEGIRAAIRTYVNRIPAAMQALAAPFDWRQLPLLRLLRCAPTAQDLARSCPALLWLMADSLNDSCFTLADASPFYVKRIKMLVNGCQAVQRERDVADFWHELSRCKTGADLENVYERLQMEHNFSFVLQRAALEEERAAELSLNERAQVRQNDLRQERQSRVETSRTKDREAVFPPPPISGNEFIKPIRSPGGLRYEGSKRAMNSCVGGMGYVHKVFQGDSYIYRVYKPERCTLEIARKADGSWFIAQLKGRGNARPKESTRRYVRSWLFESMRSA